MFLNSTRLLFLIFIFIGVNISVSSNSWLGCWIGLEVNLVSFIPLLYSNFSYYSSESSIKYFIIQSMGSLIFLFGVIFLSFDSFFNLFMLCGIFIKMGIAPFHMWLPGMVDGVSWLNCLIMFTWQKIPGLCIISYMLDFSLISVFLICSFLIGSVGGINQSSLSKLLSYSSISNMGWVIMSMKIGSFLWMIYFFVYLFMLTSLIMLFMYMNVNYINQFFFSTFCSFNKVLFSLLMYSLGGLPPFLGFFSKWLVIYYLMIDGNYFMLFFMIMTSLLTLYYYIRISMMMIMINSLFMKWYMYMLSLPMLFYFFLFFNIFGFLIIIFMNLM